MPHDDARPRPTARALAAPGEGPAPFDRVRLDWEGRFLRRRLLETAGGASILVDLPEATALQDGARLLLEDGRAVAVEALPEPLAEVRGDGPHHLARLAWHLGNRHLPCRIEPDRLLIRPDHVIERMLAHLGARVAPVTEPFQPEGGAYGGGGTHGAHGHGRGHAHDHAHGHDHGQAHRHDHARGRAHDHSHGHDDGHAHDHAHSHDDGHAHGHGHGHGRDHPHGHGHGHAQAHDRPQDHDHGPDRAQGRAQADRGPHDHGPGGAHGRG